MPAFNRVVLSGGLASGAERWSTACNFRPDGGGVVATPEGLTEWAESVAGLVAGTNLGAELRAGLSAQGTLDEVRVYHYPGTNAQATAVGIAPALGVGLTGASRPTSVAACLSLYTGVASRRTRGRMYWPALANQINTTGRFFSGVTASLAGQMAALLEDIGTEIPAGDPARPVVVSRAGDLVTRVTQVRVGDVPDTMRSRRDALDELYATAPVA